ncbi:MAG: AAA family ATPase [Anaerolineae bacterium]|nr:AAA family ATPase [Anaerolineae bacterium]
MFIDSIEIRNFRVFRETEITLVHPDLRWRNVDLPKPKLPNINLLLADNGLGKTTLLKAIALAALGPAVGDSGIFPYRLIRQEPDCEQVPEGKEAVLEARFTPHLQDGAGGVRWLESRVLVRRRGDLESLHWAHPEEKLWHPIFSASSDAFFFVGYGATRRVEKRDQIDLGSRRSSSFVRAQRVQSLFEEAYTLVPLSAWLPKYKAENPGRFKQAVGLIDRLIGEDHYEFTGEMEDGEYLFDHQGLKIPYPALSDGYRAFLGWVGDLLYHICVTCPSGNKLVDNHGIVMVDEIDLHLHPKWQMTLLPILGRALPNIQFIVTSHSPLLVGSLEWMNIVVMLPEEGQASEMTRIRQSVHGLDADQVLLTDFFGLESTRAPGKRHSLKELTLKARGGDTEAAKRLLEQMSRGMEE